MNDPHHVLTAREIMTQQLVTFRPETSIFDAIQQLVARRISGAPVIDADGKLVGMLSELDCLQVLASDEFYADDRGDTTVAECMSTGFETVSPESDVYALAQHFLHQETRRLPVIESDQLLGQVTLSDVVRGLEEMRGRRTPRKHYPDYREPA